MRRRLAVLLAATVVTGPLVVAAAAQPTPGLVDVSGLTAVVEDRAVGLDWNAADSDRDLQVLRDGAVVATLPAGSTSYDDASVRPGRTYEYRVATAKPGRVKGQPVVVPVTLPAYLVGAANRDVTPDGEVNTGGTGLGDGSLLPDAVIGRGGQAKTDGERIRARAMVVDDGTTAIAIANLEVTGHFAAYHDGEYGLEDMAELVAAENPRLPVGNILIAADHTHSGPDTLGAWGGPTEQYLELLRASVVAAIEEAYEERRFAGLRAGESDASDLIYNQSCTEGVNQSKQATYPAPRSARRPARTACSASCRRPHRAARRSSRGPRTPRTPPPAAAAGCTATGRSSCPTPWLRSTAARAWRWSAPSAARSRAARRAPSPRRTTPATT
jgi:hypothetical protein